MSRASWVWLCALVISACGPAGNGSMVQPDGGGPPPPPGSLRIEPLDAVVMVDGGVPAQLEYRAFYIDDSGDEHEVTNEASFSLVNPTLGTFAGAHFTSATDHGGKTNVKASARGKTAMTSLTVRLHAVVIGPGADPSSPGKFGGALDPGRAPDVVYPSTGVLVPPNLNELEFQFHAGPGNTLFELHFQGSALDLEVYLGCTALGAGCGFTPDETTWLLLSDAERGEDPVSYVLRGVDGANPGAVGESPAYTIAFGEEDIVGGLYYWNAGAGTILRYDFGLRGQAAESYLTAASVGASQCVGCHTLSRDGSKIAVGKDIPAPSPYNVLDVATRATIYSQGTMFGGGGANFFAFSPDATQIMTSNGVNIAWRDATTGAAIMDPLVSSGAMPDWSPDGTKLVYSQPGVAPPCFGGGLCGATGVDQGELQVLTFDGANWSSPTSLVPYSGQNNYYPSFSPDGSFVLFNRSPGDLNSYDAPDAQVWVVPTAGGNPIQLATASTGGDSWPKWAPNVQIYRGGSLLWLTFSSRRAYGLRLGAGERAQIWMAAFDPAKALAGQDPSVVAFWLPFQEIGSGNHIAQWVLEVDRQPCGSDEECATGEFCEGGICVPGID